MDTHSWYTVSSGIGVRCSKCGAYINILYEEDFKKLMEAKTCPETSEDKTTFLEKIFNR